VLKTLLFNLPKRTKMKRITILVAMVATMGSFAQTSENFNSRSHATLTQVKSHLQNHCWQFTDFDVNNSGWNPGIEGDGAMVSGLGNSSTENTGIYSQALNMTGNIDVSFKYKFSSTVSQRRWLKLYLTDGNNNVITRLDSIELTGAHNNTLYNFNKSFSVPHGCYKIYINYQGIGGSARIAIDKLNFNALTFYSGGCNQPPVAVNDNVPGASNHTAGGTVIPNDFDPENGILTAQLVTNSADGNVLLNSSGSFTFTPNAGFTGSSTTFRYIVCDNGTPGMCSNTATATINFPIEGSLPVTIVDLGATYSNGKVNIKWTSTFEVNNDHFEIERSTDGINYKTTGSIKGQGTSSIKHEYEFADNVKQNTINKNDLYYRLKQVDLDSKSTYSKILIVRVYQTKSLESVSVTPNPTFNDIKVNLQLNENSYIVLKVANSNGVELMRKSMRGATGSNAFTMDGTSRLQAGAYFLEVIINSNERMMVKLIKN
jgi:Bacterial Ig domain